MTQEILSEKSIDIAIESVEKQISEHKSEARKILLYVIGLSGLLLTAAYSIYWIQEIRLKDNQAKISAAIDEVIQSSTTTGEALRSGLNEVAQSTSLLPDPSLIYVFVGVFVVVFGVMMAVYRFHLAEISRAQQYRFGLMRVRIAANNAESIGFDSEVRQALTNDAFHFSTGKEKKVESPLPGHPASDAGALFINKILEKMDIQVKPKE